MKKSGVPVCNRTNSTRKSTNGCKGGVVKSNYSKRLHMMQRRLMKLINEKQTWDEQNKELSHTLEAEKLLSASLRKEAIHLQRKYHESAITLNSYKMKEFEMAQVLTTVMKENDAIYHHLVAFSDIVTNNKIRVSGLLASLPSSGNANNSGGIRDEVRESSERTKCGVTKTVKEKPMKQSVVPMVKGLLVFTKPKIVIERLRLPDTDNQEQDLIDDADLNERPLALSPIAEEEQTHSFPRNVSVRQKRSRLGSFWRLKNKEKLEKDQHQEKERQLPRSYNEDSTDSEGIPVSTTCKKSVKLLPHLNSSLAHIGESENVTESSRRHIDIEDPMEGSSWMFNNYFRSSHVEECRKSGYNSDSTDSDDCLTIHTTFDKRKCSSQNSSQSISMPKPDTTIIVDTPSVSPVTTSSPEPLTDFPVTSNSPKPSKTDFHTATNMDHQRQSLNVHTSDNLRVSLTIDSSINTSNIGRCSDSSSHEAHQLEPRPSLGKRIKKANVMYKEYVMHSTNQSQQKANRQSVGQTQIVEKKESKTSKSIRSSKPSGPELAQDSKNCAKKSDVITKRKKNSKTSTRIQDDAQTPRNSIIVNPGDSKNRSKKSDAITKRGKNSKTSTRIQDDDQTPKNSIINIREDSVSSTNEVRKRRNLKSVNYQESPLKKGKKH